MNRKVAMAVIYRPAVGIFLRPVVTYWLFLWHPLSIPTSLCLCARVGEGYMSGYFGCYLCLVNTEMKKDKKHNCPISVRSRTRWVAIFELSSWSKNSNYLLVGMRSDHWTVADYDISGLRQR